LSAGIGIDLRVEHEQFHVGPVLQDHFGDVLKSNVTERAVTAHHPDFGQLANFLIRHQSVVQVRVREILGFGNDPVRALEQRVTKAFRHHGAPGVIEYD